MSVKEKRVLKALLYGLKNMPKCNFSLLLRTEAFQIVGVMTAKKPEMDVSKGMPRMWAVGVDLDGKVFKEPLDRWVPEKGTYESVLFVENPQGIAVTCRRKAEGEEEDNFLYFDNPLDVAEVKKLEATVSGYERQISSLMKKLSSMQQERDFWMNEARQVGDELRSIRELYARQSRELAQLRAQVELFKRYAFAAEAFATRVESTLRASLMEAEKAGETLGVSVIQRVSDAARQLRELREEMTAITGPTVETEAKLSRLEAEIRRIKEASPAPKEAT